MNTDFSIHNEALRQIEAAMGLTDAEKTAMTKLSPGPEGIAYSARQKAKMLTAAKASVYRLIVDEALHSVSGEIYEAIAESHGHDEASERTTKTLEEARKSFRAADDAVISRIAEALLEIKEEGRPFQLRDITSWGDGNGNSLFPMK